MITENNLKKLKILWHTYCYHHLEDRNCPDNFSCGGLNTWGIYKEGKHYYSNWKIYIICSRYRAKKICSCLWAGKIHRAIKKLKKMQAVPGSCN